MEVIRVDRFGGPEVLVAASAADPEAGPGQLVVSVAASDVLFVDTLIRSGWAKEIFPIRPPYVPGSGVAGVVIGAGDGVDGSWIGRRVAGHTGGSSGGGGYASRAVVACEDAVAVPDGVALAEAAAMVHDGPTALRVMSVIGVSPGEDVLILGAAGGMGVLLVQLVRAAGARVIGAARGKAKLDAVASVGADVVVDYGEEGWTSEVVSVTGGAGPTVVLDGVGGALGRAAYEVMADGGRYSAHGAPSGSFADLDASDAGRRGVTVRTLADLQHEPGGRATLAGQLVDDVAAGRIRPVIGQTFPLEDAAQAHARMAARETIAKSLLIP